jgi:hypothetical protein
MKRKIIQILKLEFTKLLAVCDDGTVWVCKQDANSYAYGDWKPATHEVIRDIPQPKE